MSMHPAFEAFDGTEDVLELTLDDETMWSFRVDRASRRLAGKLLPWGAVATDANGMGKWRFGKGSLSWGNNVSRVKLLRDHDVGQPVGKAVALEDRSDGLYGVFQVARGEKGDEVLSLAEDGVLDGFSVGPRIEPDGWEADPNERGVRFVTAGKLVETTVTAIPAYDDARVHHVAAMLRLPSDDKEGSMSTDNKNKSGEGEGQGSGTTVLDDPDAALAKFQESLDQRFDAMATKIGEIQETQSESVTKIITDSFEAAYGAMEGPNTGHRAQNAAARLKVTKEEPVYRFDGEQRGQSMVRDFWRANTERDQDAVERLRKFQAQQRDMVDLLVKTPPSVRAAFAGAATTNADTDSVIPPGYRPDLFVNELMQSRPIVAQASRGTITDATPFVVPRFVSSTGLTADHVEGTNPGNGTIVIDSITVSPGAVSGMFELTREIVDAANPAIDAIALAAMRESYNQQTEVKAYAALNGSALAGNTEVSPDLTAASDGSGIGLLRSLLADYPFHRFAAPTGAVMSQGMTRHLATAVDGDNRPLLPSVGASNASGVGNAVNQGWFVDGLPFVPAWAMTEALSDDVAIITNRSDWWAWESPLLTFRFEEKQGPAKIELALFAYFATAVLRPAGFAALRRPAA
jgi:HK97 family phage prohead protease/HK97 family phage major capsid protein